MEISEYPTFTVIMRGYTPQQAEAIMSALSQFDNEFGVEVTMNTPHALEIIENGNREYGNKLKIGAGTVLDIKQAKDAIEKGAQFMLSPVDFSDEIFRFAKEKGVITVPAAMTPKEVHDMFNKGADIVKIFPATTVGSAFFKDIQAPLGRLNLMAVGGISKDNAKEFLMNGASYLGIGSKMFSKHDLENLNVSGMVESLKEFLEIKASI